MDKTIITLIGSALIIFIYWFFFGKKEEAVEVNDNQTIIVDGGYKPSVIRISRDKPVTLTFLRKDTNSCLEEVNFPDYKINKYLPLNTPTPITLLPPHPPNSEFHCSMNMFHGKIIII